MASGANCTSKWRPCVCHHGSGLRWMLRKHRLSPSDQQNHHQHTPSSLNHGTTKSDFGVTRLLFRVVAIGFRQQQGYVPVRVSLGLQLSAGLRARYCTFSVDCKRGGGRGTCTLVWGNSVTEGLEAGSRGPLVAIFGAGQLPAVRLLVGIVCRGWPRRHSIFVMSMRCLPRPSTLRLLINARRPRSITKP